MESTNFFLHPFGSSMVFTPPSVPPAIGGQKRQSGESNIEHFAFILHFSFFIVQSNIVTFSMKYRKVFSWWIEEKLYGDLVADVDNYLKISCMEILFVNYFALLHFCTFGGYSFRGGCVRE